MSLFARALIAAAVFTSTIHALTYVGCFEPPIDLELDTRFRFQSVGWCKQRCISASMLVLGVANGTDCLCGASEPPRSSIVEDYLCNVPCAGYAPQKCGGREFISVYHILEPGQPETTDSPPSESESVSQPVEPTETGITVPEASGANPQDMGELKA
ncbi:hypothetical protein GGR54DRAFT_271600 [Hypoxylon sp. NC1633]|nr:hypothetical protein GGR54DRAFT_271600 [Hypoxylon sp. NC1633]